MEILKHDSGLEVLSPASLKKRVIEELKKNLVDIKFVGLPDEILDRPVALSPIVTQDPPR
jgi:hypothetical protein